MPVTCRKCNERLSIIAIKRNIYVIYALVKGVHGRNLLNNLSRIQDRHFHPEIDGAMSSSWQRGFCLGLSSPSQNIQFGEIVYCEQVLCEFTFYVASRHFLSISPIGTAGPKKEFRPGELASNIAIGSYKI
jgi:hypothetical protein